jgi:acyl-ACP thioesterase
MAEKYLEKYTISCYEADASQALKPIAMLDWMQEIAGRDATRLGFGYDNLMASNTAWVLSRTHVRFHQYPKWRDNVNLLTWHKGAFKVLYLRDFELKSETGEPLVSATTSWLIIDMNTRRMVRNAELSAGPETCLFEHAIEEPADKIIIPTDLEATLAATHKVVWSDIDTMAHVNNVKYVAWALDAIDESILREKPLKEIIVNYDAEVLLGEEVTLYLIKQETVEGLICYIQGKVEDKVKFSVKMHF